MAVDTGTTRTEILSLSPTVRRGRDDRAGRRPLICRRGCRKAPAGDALHRLRLYGAHPHRATYPDAAVLKLTSGSTGLPKATLTTEAQLVADSAHIVAAMGIGRRDTQMAAIPLSHSYGLGNLVMPLLLQGTAIVLRESFVPHQLPADARRFGARVFPACRSCSSTSSRNPPADGWPPCLHRLISAGAPLTPRRSARFTSASA